jgi:hypothetical protein
MGVFAVSPHRGIARCGCQKTDYDAAQVGVPTLLAEQVLCARRGPACGGTVMID